MAFAIAQGPGRRRLFVQRGPVWSFAPRTNPSLCLRGSRLREWSAGLVRGANDHTGRERSFNPGQVRKAAGSFRLSGPAVAATTPGRGPAGGPGGPIRFHRVAADHPQPL